MNYEFWLNGENFFVESKDSGTIMKLSPGPILLDTGDTKFYIYDPNCRELLEYVDRD